MNKIFTVAAAAATLAIANTSLAPVAEAGGGVRLQFGYPLGSFVARPCGSCGGSYSHRSHHNSYAARRRAAIIAKKRAAAKAAHRAAIAEARQEKIAEIRRAKLASARAKARRERLSEARRQARLSKEHHEEQEIAKTENEPATPETAPLPVRPQIEPADIAIGEPKVILAEPKKVAAAPPVPSKPLDCKKYLPSAGLTITVPCQ